jgi:putative DNA primase/helicase
MISIIQRARQFAATGYSVTPVSFPGANGGDGKAPIKGYTWKDRQAEALSPDEAEALFKSFEVCNLGIVCGTVSGGIFGVDLDGPEAIAWALQNLPPTPTVVVTPRGEHWYFRFPEGKVFRNSASKLFPGVDVRGEGGILVGPGSMHSTQVKYTLRGEVVRPEDLPVLDLDELCSGSHPCLGHDPPIQSAALVGNRNDSCYRWGCKQADQNVPYHDAVQNVIEMFCNAGFVFADDFTVEELKRAVGNAYKYSRNRQVIQAVQAQEESSGLDLAGSATLLSTSEDTDADHATLFEMAYGAIIRFCPTTKSWWCCNGGVWSQGNGSAFNRMEQIAHARLAQVPATDKKARSAAKGRLNATRIRCALEIASCRPGLQLNFSLFDHGNILACSNGVYDLERDLFRPPSPDDYITVVQPYAFEPGAPCPQFLQAMDMYFDNDDGLIRGIQELFGLCVSNQPASREIFILYGGPGTGKTTLIEVLANLLGRFSTQLDADAFNGRDPKGRVAIQFKGKRVVVMSELSPRMKANGALIKRYSGGDTIFGRDLWDRVDNPGNQFKPRHVLIWAANDFPGFDHRDSALMERVRVIPMSAAVPPDRRIARFWDCLQAELPGILNWALEGWRRLQAQGLTTSLKTAASVHQATQAMQVALDTVTRFIDDECQIGDASFAFGRDLHLRYTEYCESAGLSALNNHEFAEELRRRGYSVKSRIFDGRGSRKIWVGLGLAQPTR